MRGRSGTIDAERVAPVGERVDDQVLRGTVAGVEVATDAGVVPRILEVGGERVVGRIVEPAEGLDVVDGEPVAAAPGAALAGVVVDHVDPDLDADIVEGLDHRLPFARRATRRLVGRIAPIRREVVQRHVAPVVVAGVRRRIDIVGVVLRFLHRQELDGGDAEPREVRRLQRRAGIRASLGGRHRGVVHRQAAHVHFVDHVVLQRARRFRADRGGARREHDALRRARAAVLVAMRGAAGIHRAVEARRHLRIVAD